MKEDSEDEKGEKVVQEDEENVKANCVDKSKIWDYKTMP